MQAGPCPGFPGNMGLPALNLLNPTSGLVSGILSTSTSTSTSGITNRLFIKCLRQVPLRAWKGKILSTGSVCGSLHVLYRFECRKGRFSMPKRCQKGTQNNPNGTQRVAKTSKGTFKDTLAEQSRTNIEKGCQNTQTGVPTF